MLNEVFFSISMTFHNHKIMDNISKKQNEKWKFNFCSINDINSFVAKNYIFKSLINLSQNSTRKYSNIILSNSHIGGIHNIF